MSCWRWFLNWRGRQENKEKEEAKEEDGRGVKLKEKNLLSVYLNRRTDYNSLFGTSHSNVHYNTVGGHVGIVLL